MVTAENDRNRKGIIELAVLIRLEQASLVVNRNIYPTSHSAMTVRGIRDFLEHLTSVFSPRKIWL